MGKLTQLKPYPYCSSQMAIQCGGHRWYIIGCSLPHLKAWAGRTAPSYGPCRTTVGSAGPGSPMGDSATKPRPVQKEFQPWSRQTKCPFSQGHPADDGPMSIEFSGANMGRNSPSSMLIPGHEGLWRFIPTPGSAQQVASADDIALTACIQLGWGNMLNCLRKKTLLHGCLLQVHPAVGS